MGPTSTSSGPPFAVDGDGQGEHQAGLRPSNLAEYFPTSQRNVYIAPSEGRSTTHTASWGRGSRGLATFRGFGVVSSKGGQMITARSATANGGTRAADGNHTMAQELAYGVRTTSIPPAYFKPWTKATTMSQSSANDRKRREERERARDIALVRALP